MDVIKKSISPEKGNTKDLTKEFEITINSGILNKIKLYWDENVIDLNQELKEWNFSKFKLIKWSNKTDQNKV
jgi:hypothetical protein